MWMILGAAASLPTLISSSLALPSNSCSVPQAARDVDDPGCGRKPPKPQTLANWRCKSPSSQHSCSVPQAARDVDDPGCGPKPAVRGARIRVFWFAANGCQEPPSGQCTCSVSRKLHERPWMIRGRRPQPCTCIQASIV